MGGLELSSGLDRCTRVGLLNAASRWQRDELQNSGGQPVPEKSDPEGRTTAAVDPWGIRTGPKAPGIPPLNSYPSPGRTPLNPRGADGRFPMS